MSADNQAQRPRGGVDAKVKRGEPGMTKGVAAVQERNMVSYDLANKFFKISIFTSIFGIVGLVIGILGWTVRPAPTYFATDDAGRITPIVALSHPLLGPSEVINWTAQSVTKALSYDYLNYRKQLSAVETYFTADGFQEYLLSLKKSGNLDSVIKSMYLVDATLQSTPVIVNDGDAGGQHFWNIKMSLLVGYHAGKSQVNQNLTAIVTVVRVPPDRNSEGIAIQKLVLSSN